MKMLSRLLTALLFLATAAISSGAQTAGNWDSGRPQLTRGELGDLLARLEQMSDSTGYSGEIRGKAREEAAMVRARLENGDLKVGDQIALVVEGEDSLSQTYVVKPGGVITLPGIGDVPLQGVLRSELENHLTAYLAKYIREPVVHAESLLRVTVSGSVLRPGFYGVRADRLLSDAIMEAGGPGPASDLNAIYIERAGKRIWDGPYLQKAIADGRTLDQLSLQAGDQIVVPAEGTPFSSRMLAVVTGVASVAALLVTIFR